MNKTLHYLSNSYTEIIPYVLKQTSDIIILISVEDNIIFRYALVNDKALSLLGWTENIYGKTINEVLPKDKVDIVLERYKKVIDTGTGVTYEEPIRLENGHIIGEVIMTPIFDHLNNCTHILTVIRDITKQSATEEELEKNQTFLNAFLENSGDALSIWNLKGEVLEINPAFEKLFGWKKEELIGKMTIKTGNFVPEDKQGEADYFRRQMFQGETISDYRTQRKHKDGRLIDVSVTYSPIKDKDGNVMAAALSIRDISKSKKLEDQLRKAKEQLELIWDHTADGIIMFSLEGQVVNINPAFTSLFGWSGEDTEGTVPNIRFIPEHLSGEVHEIRRRLKNGEIINGLETQRRKKDGSFLDVMATYNPIKDQTGEVWAAVGVYKDISEYQKIKNKLIESEKRFKSLFDNNLDAIYSFDPNGHYLYINPAAERITGYCKEDLIGKPFAPIILPSELERTAKLFKKAAQGEPQEYETSMIHCNGHKIDLLVKNIPIIVDDRVVGVYGISKDITKEKQTLKELHDAKKKLESFIEDSSDIVNLVDREGRVLLINETFSEAYGYGKEEVIGKKLPIIPEGMEEETAKHYGKVWLGNKVRGIEVKRKRKDGTIVDISLTLSPIYDENGQVVAVSGVGRDITERKYREKELKEVKDELELIWNNTVEPIFLIARDGSILKANPAFENMFGWTCDELKNCPVPPIVPESFKSERAGRLEKLVQGHDLINDEVQRLTKDGIILDILASYRAIDKGEFIAVGMYKDVTRQKQIQATLAESEERYRMLVEHSPEATLVHSEGQFIYANKAGLNLLGAKNEEDIIGKYMMAFVHPDSREMVLKRAQRIRELGEPQGLIEHKGITLEGKTIEVEVSSMPVLFNGKKAIHSIIRDVTERKKMEGMIRESDERYRLIAQHSHDMIKVLNRDGVITYASPSHEKVLGFKPQELLGKPLFEIVHKEDVQGLKDKFSLSVANNSVCQSEFRQYSKNGRWVWVEAVGTPIVDDHGIVRQYTVAARDITQRKQYEEQLKDFAFRDSLTGLYNRRMFTELIDNAINDAKRYHRSFAVMYLDMDKFKSINDTLGHDVGDELLIQFAGRLKAAARKSDILARMGGDEFTVLLLDIDGLNGIVEAAERIHEALQAPYEIGEHKFITTSSIGIALYPEHGEKAKILVRHADEALYKAKQSRNSYCIYR